MYPIILTHPVYYMIFKWTFYRLHFLNEPELSTHLDGFEYNKGLNSPIRPIADESGPGSNENKEVLHDPQKLQN